MKNIAETRVKIRPVVIDAAVSVVVVNVVLVVVLASAVVASARLP